MEIKTDTDRATRLAPVNYHCATHGVWDATKESGCPTCVRKMRHELKADRAKLALYDEMVEALETIASGQAKTGQITGPLAGYQMQNLARAALAKVKEIS